MCFYLNLDLMKELIVPWLVTDCNSSAHANTLTFPYTGVGSNSNFVNNILNLENEFFNCNYYFGQKAVCSELIAKLDRWKCEIQSPQWLIFIGFFSSQVYDEYNYILYSLIVCWAYICSYNLFIYAGDMCTCSYISWYVWKMKI